MVPPSSQDGDPAYRAVPPPTPGFVWFALTTPWLAQVGVVLLFGALVGVLVLLVGSGESWSAFWVYEIALALVALVIAAAAYLWAVWRHRRRCRAHWLKMRGYLARSTQRAAALSRNEAGAVGTSLGAVSSPGGSEPVPEKM